MAPPFLRAGATAVGVNPPDPIFSALPGDAEIAGAHLLAGPLLPLPAQGPARPSIENRALADALLQYRASRDWEDFRPLIRFLQEHPRSRYEPALLVNLGVLYRQQGRVSRAFTALERAWSLTKGGTDKNSLALANWALGEFAGMHAHLDPARRAQLDAELDALGRRDLHGPTVELVSTALQERVLREEHPEEAYRCGPMSLALVRQYLQLPEAPEILRARPARQGFSLAQLEELAVRHGMKMRAIHAGASAPVPFPAVIHWKYDHYSAVLERRLENGRESFRVQNPLLEQDIWMSREAIEEETSGFFLILDDRPGDAYRTATEDEKRNVWGRCEFFELDPTQVFDLAIKTSCPIGSRGMATYNFHAALASLNITDTPIGYTPPVGPPAQFTVTYNQRESSQPAVFSYSNLGPKWTFSWMSYVLLLNPPVVFLPNGGEETHQLAPKGTPAGGNPNATYYDNHAQTGALLLLDTKAQTWERHLPDGTVQYFGLRENVSPNRYFMTRVVDPQGNALTFAYDNSFRLRTATDASGLVTTLTYGLPDPLKITAVTDPFGRTAKFSYDAQGRLTTITDVIGLTSSFTYGPNDFISEMVTPYGKTTFQTGAVDNPSTVLDTFISATDPNGDTERAEFRNKVPSLPVRDDWNDALNTGGSRPIPFLNTRLTLYWDKNAWKQAPGDPSQARLYRWLDGPLQNRGSGILDYTKNALEGRVQRHYPGQTKPYYSVGTTAMPSAIMSLLEDGVTPQMTLVASNAYGHLTQYTDPAGRQTVYTYDANGIDLLEIRNPATNETYAKFTYNSQHRPLTYQDASGGVSAYTYNAAGQLTSITNAKHETTAFTYDSRGDLLLRIGPVPSDLTRYTYDSFGRIRTVTDSEGYVLTYDYDPLDRPIAITYPDKTTSQTAYQNLDPVAFTDRQGRVTRVTYDATRRPVATTDAAGQTTSVAWCGCGEIAQMTDANGNTTVWNRDTQGRVVSKIFADGTSTQYTYDPMTGRLAQVTDAKGQTTAYQFLPDGNLQQISYSGGAATAPVTFTYDPNVTRVSGMTDGIGATSYVYGRGGLPGGFQVASVTGPLGETTVFTYDELNRVIGAAIDGVSATVTYDPLGRITSKTNALGRFGYTYVNATGRPQSIAYPNGSSTQFTYFDNTADRRLKEIVNLGPGNAVVSQFDHTYSAAGEMTSWTRLIPEAGPLQSGYQFNYDKASRLTAANLTASDGTALGAYGYGYDGAGNLSAWDLNGAVTSLGFNNTNQAQGFLYDANGNLTADSSRGYEWDAANRLTAVTVGNHRSEFGYDGVGRRVRITEKDDGAVTSDRYYVWCGAAPCEERTLGGGGTAVAKRFFALGETETAGGADTPYYYTLDHLGSVRQLTDGSGAVVASYDYDPWGQTNKLAGGKDAAFGYAGYFAHAASGLSLTPFRAYDSATSRWLSRDPIAEAGGTNLYGYVSDNPVSAIDSLGLGKFIVDYGYVGSPSIFASGRFIPLGHVSYVTNTGRTYQMTIQGLQILDTGVPPDKRANGLASYLIDPNEYDDKVVEQIYKELKPKLPWYSYLWDLPTNTCIGVVQRVRNIYYKRTGQIDPLQNPAPETYNVNRAWPSPEGGQNPTVDPQNSGIGGIIF